MILRSGHGKAARSDKYKNIRSEQARQLVRKLRERTNNLKTRGSSMKKYKYSIVIGRFQPVHNGHVDLINHAMSISDHTIIVVGSSHKPVTPKNPFTDTERARFFIELGLYTEDTSLVYAVDYMYNDEKWVSEVHKKVSDVTGIDVKKNEVCLVGHRKDESTWYLDMFPHWHYEEYSPPNVQDLHATEIRQNIYHYNYRKIEDQVPQCVYDCIKQKVDTKGFDAVIDEFFFNLHYQKTVSQYPRIEQTTDVVVIQSGHVLLIQRGQRPGKGLWAFPGGFVGQKERVYHAAIRELVEETKIDVPAKTLYANLDNIHGVRFDHPDRDPRGRIITTAFRIHLPHIGKLTKVKGSDDAAKAEWKSFEWVRENTDQMYADHYEIFERMVGDL